MRSGGPSVAIEFLLKERVYSLVERKLRVPWALGAELVIKIETARALDEELYLRARKAPLLAAIVPVGAPVRVVSLYKISHKVYAPCTQSVFASATIVPMRSGLRPTERSTSRCVRT